MSSRLETIPHDVLRCIAFLCGSSSTFEPPVAIFHLLQTSSVVHQSLNVPATPDLYAHIFSTKFDTKATFRRYRKRMTDSALAAELLRRCQVLRRSHRLNLSPNYLLQDLWAALWMFLENDDYNQQQLSAVHFTNFILSLARHTLSGLNPEKWSINSNTLKHLILWLLCLSLPRRLILDMSKQDRNELYSLIFPYIFLSLKKTTGPRPPTAPYCPVPLLGLENGSGENSSHRRLYGTSDLSQVYTYHRGQNPSVPDPSTAAINLAFVILEATPVKVPYHLPETRVIATANQVSGPTKEDYYSLASYRTPLPSDINSCTALNQARSLIPEGSRRYDVEFGGILRSLDDRGISETFEYIPGTMTGLWEGVFRTLDPPQSGPSSSHFNPLLSAVMIKPMQCKLVEYVCSGSDLPPDQRRKAEDVPLEPVRIAVKVKSDCEIIADGRTYRKYIGPADAKWRPSALSPYDVILLGETLADHDQAWGAFRFSGRIQSYGHLSLKREAKGDGDQGVWIFEGHLQRGTVILGRWRITGSPNALDHGIFSLGKVLRKWQV